MKKLAFIDKDRCVACGACVNVCPMNAISVWRGCYSVVNDDKCVGCGKCAKACPAVCIEIRTREVMA